jgi:eukaryotic-like serine/threonine-protein kinase
VEVDFRVAGWVIQPGLNVVVAPDGTVTHLEPRVMDVLQFLARQPGEVHPKEQIIQAVWKDTFVTDDALSRCILELRRVFGDHSREPRIIKTIPKRGYCLVAPVSALQAPAERYETLRILGQSPLSRVFLAKDTELRRMVVLKFLAAEKSADEKSRRRLLHEARAAAALDHPFICKIYDSGTLHGEPYVAMEYVEGQTLKQRLTSGPLPLPEALQTAAEIAEALEAAHARGIVHRDIKPSNIMLAKQGHAKVLDFGVAKRLMPAGTEAGNTSTSRDGEEATGGTVAYMSPEQLRGQAVLTTSDVFSFGLVLYEMVAGTHPFQRESPIDTAAGILHDEPPPLPQTDAITSPVLRHIIGRTLAKDAAQRYPAIRDARTDILAVLDEIRAASKGGNGHGRTPPAEESASEDISGRGKRHFPVVATAALLIVAAAVASLVGWLRRLSAERVQPLVRAVIPVSPAHRLAGWNSGIEFTMASGRPTRPAIAFSPDGRRLVFCGATESGTRLYSRLLANDTVAPISGTEGGTAPFFSPDGRRLGFWVDGSLRVMETGGGQPVEVCIIRDAESPPCGADWLSPGEVVFALPLGEIWKVPVTGGTPVAVTRLEGSEVSHRLPHILPGGRGLLFTSLDCLDSCEPQVVVQSLDSGARRTLVRNGADARYVDGGFLMFARQGKLLAARFELRSLTLLGPPAPVLESVAHASSGWGDFRSLAAQFSLSKDGHLAFATGGEPPSGSRYLAAVSQDGNSRRIPIDTPSVFRPRISADGKRITVVSRSRIWTTDFAGSPLREITSDRKTGCVLWTPDGKSLTFDFAENGSGTQIREIVLGTGSVRVLVEPDGKQVPGSWHPGGRILAFVKQMPAIPADWSHRGNTDIWIYDRVLGRSSPLVQSPHRESSPDFSRDGKWLAYVSSESGEAEVMVIPFPAAGARPTRVSARGGHEPLWAPDGRQLLWRDLAGSVWAADVSTSPALVVGAERKLLEGTWKSRPDRWTREFDITPDGKQFVRAEADTLAAPIAEITIIANWLGELRRLTSDAVAR